MSDAEKPVPGDQDDEEYPFSVESLVLSADPATVEAARDLLKRFPRKRDVLGLVDVLVRLRCSSATHGERNAVLNALAQALGLRASRLRESEQSEVQAMSVYLCKAAQRRMRKGEDVEIVAAWLAGELLQTHRAFSCLTPAGVVPFLEHTKSHLELCENLARKAGLQWGAAALKKAPGRPPKRRQV